jgi:hypothetical protein
MLRELDNHLMFLCCLKREYFEVLLNRMGRLQPLFFSVNELQEELKPFSK